MKDYRDGTVLAGNLPRARELRRTQTDCEALLWRELRNRAFTGVKFRRQHPYGIYILDFYCTQARLAIELDGDGHAAPAQARRDVERTRFLAAHGIRELRFGNRQLLFEREAVLVSILRALHGE